MLDMYAVNLHVELRVMVGPFAFLKSVCRVMELVGARELRRAASYLF